MLVDDNDDILARAAAVLRSGCAIVGAVKDGGSALEAARALRPDVIVLDISMPGMTGFEVAARLAESGSDAAVVFLTVHDDEELKQAAEAAGAAGYVVKPRLASDLLIAVCEARARRLGAQSTDPRSRRANPPEPEH
ncbi:MAG TPA: response regulator [Vicinamibacterales bacterium]|nr:response regulator [Vicinamibacterales bacterium]